jgi:hypothetical protein
MHQSTDSKTLLAPDRKTLPDLFKLGRVYMLSADVNAYGIFEVKIKHINQSSKSSKYCMRFIKLDICSHHGGNDPCSGIHLSDAVIIRVGNIDIPGSIYIPVPATVVMIPSASTFRMR